MSARLYEDFKEFLEAFNRYSVKYMVVGGYAVVYHGYNRTTGDLDVWVEQSSQNFSHLKKAFGEFGLPVNAISEQDFLSNELDVFTFGSPPVCIEIITGVKGLDFEPAYSNSQKIIFDGVVVNMIDFRDLIKNKKALGRHKDLDDIDHLIE